VLVPDVIRSGNYTVYDRWPEGDSGYEKQLPEFQLPENPKELPAAIASIVRAIRTDENFTRLRQPRGDILAFVPTVAIVNETVEKVKALELPELEVLPCHAQMSREEHKRFKESEAKARRPLDENGGPAAQRAIMATNYAETSVTISNLSYVIDSGYIIEPEWDPTTCSTSYWPVPHSQAGCTQRRGRVGRIQPGECFRLYTREQFENFRKMPRPAISREAIDTFLLTAKAAGIDDLDSFSWLGRDGEDEKQEKEFQRAKRALEEKDIIDKDGDITERGIELNRIEGPRIDLLLFMSESDTFGCALEVATFLGFLQQGSAFRRGPTGLASYSRWRRGCYDDLEFYLRIFHHWSQVDLGGDDYRKKWCTLNQIDYGFMQEVCDARDANLRQFSRRTHTELSNRSLDLARLHRVRLVLARCAPEWIYVKDPENAGFFVPHDRSRNSSTIRLEIDEASACRASADLEA
ncbi:MAG: helicase-related protein, partial [bacterium]